MKKIAHLLVVGTITALSVMGGSAFAADEVDYWNNYDPIIPEKGQFTSDYPVFSRLLTSPVRAVTTVGGAVVGSVCGVGKGIVHAEQVVSKKTFERTPEENAAIMVPAGMVGSILAVPVGAAHGAVRGFGQGTITGFMMPEAY